MTKTRNVTLIINYSIYVKHFGLNWDTDLSVRSRFAIESVFRIAA